ncbi:MAG: DinB family protein [Sphingobacteriales bacterium]
MLNETLKTLFKRDLTKLKEEINSYQKENNIWIVADGISNSAGNLCLHLIGNTNHFIGAVLGSTGYIRHRDLEFSSKDVPSTELIKKIEDTILMVDSVLDTITADQFEALYPLEPLGYPMTTEYFLIHLATHLGYHLGQVNYHKRLLDK